jgi:hypothetical protein
MIRQKRVKLKGGILRLTACLFISLMVWCCVLPAVSAAKDLKQWNPHIDGSLPLTGPWEFYWNRLLEPADFADGSPESGRIRTVTTPAQWKSYEIDGQALPNEGYATYRMTFTLSDEAVAQPLALYVNNVATAYRIWINGMPMNGVGTVGTDIKSMIPRSHPKVYFFTPRHGVNELVIQVSNFVQRTGGIWENIELGDAEEMAAAQRTRILLWALLTGCLLVMAFFSVFLILFRRQERAALWFGLICLAICIRSSLLGESYIYVLFPGLSWEWGVKLEYLSEITTILSLAAFVNKQYPQDEIRRLFPIFAAGLSGFAAFVLAAPAKVYTQFMVPYILALLLPVFLYVTYVYIRASFRHRSGSRTNMIGFIGFFISVIHEILYYTGFLPFGGLVSFGLLFC